MIKSSKKNPIILKQKKQESVNKVYEEAPKKNKIKYIVNSVFEDTPLKKYAKYRPSSAIVAKNSAPRRNSKNNSNDSSIFQNSRAFVNKSVSSINDILMMQS